MADQVFEIAALKKRALELLRRHDSYMPTVSVALQLGVPLYAAASALEAAYQAFEVVYVAGVGWKARDAEAAAPVDQGQMNIGGGW